jgi:hypothetical protein
MALILHWLQFPIALYLPSQLPQRERPRNVSGAQMGRFRSPVHRASMTILPGFGASIHGARTQGIGPGDTVQESANREPSVRLDDAPAAEACINVPLIAVRTRPKPRSDHATEMVRSGPLDTVVQDLARAEFSTAASNLCTSAASLLSKTSSRFRSSRLKPMAPSEP